MNFIKKKNGQKNVGLDFCDASSDWEKNNQDNYLNDKKLTTLVSITVNRKPSSDKELGNKKYLDDELEKNTSLRLNQNLRNYLKVSVGNDTYNLTKCRKIQLTDTTIIKTPNSDGYLLQQRNIKIKDKKNSGKIRNFVRSTKTISPTGVSGATSLPPTGDSFMYIETESNNNGDNVFVSLEGTDIIQLSNITIYYNRFSILNKDSLKSMGRFRIQLLLDDDTWSTRFSITQKDRYSDTSTDSTLVSLKSTKKIMVLI